MTNTELAQYNPDGTLTEAGILKVASGHLCAYYGGGFVLLSAERVPNRNAWNISVGHRRAEPNTEIASIRISEFGVVISAPPIEDVDRKLNGTTPIPYRIKA